MTVNKVIARFKTACLDCIY